MTDGLIHSYIETLGQTLRPHDDYYWPGRDSKTRRRTLRSLPHTGGDSHDDDADIPRSNARSRA